MWKNYLIVALRNLRRQKGYTALNVAGLAVGLACCGFIGLYVQDELGYDRHHERADHVYRLGRDVTIAGEAERGATTAAPVAPAIEAEFPEVRQAVRVVTSSGLFERPGAGGARVRFQEPEVAYADADVFRVFSFPFVQGTPDRALAEPNTVVLTETTARKYFGDADPMGQTLLLDNAVTLTVTGVMADLPATSDLAFGALLSWGTWEATAPDWLLTEWNANYLYTYVLLAAGTDPEALAGRLTPFVERNLAEESRAGFEAYALSLQPLTAIHLDAPRVGEATPPGDPATLALFAVIGGFVLLIACVNFVNLATARAAQRAREVGLRKAIGAWRGQLVGQFLSESVLLGLGAFAVALVLSAVLLPGFNALAGKSVGWADAGPYVVLLGGLALLVGVGAGAYPAFALSGFQPASVLRGPLRVGRRGTALRKGLVVFQFATSIVLIVGTAVVFSQLGHMRGQRLGFDSEQLLVVNFQGDTAVQEQWERVRRTMAEQPGVVEASMSSSVPGEGQSTISVVYEGPDGAEGRDALNEYAVDYAFVPTLGVRLVAGRNFSEAVPADTARAYVLNEAAVARLGYPNPEAAVGRRFNMAGVETVGEIVGVVEDFHYQSLQHPVEPLFLHVFPEFFGFLTVRTAGGDARQAVAALERAWGEAVPHRPFEYVFLDESFDGLYQAEARFGRIFGVFAGLAIFVACLGLFGLASFTAQQRTKEVGVRKVLGASAASIVGLLSRDVLALVAVAFVVAAPVGYLAASRWLEGFAARVPLGPGVFALAGALALVIALGTVGTQALRAASADPVQALRSE